MQRPCRAGGHARGETIVSSSIKQHLITLLVVAIWSVAGATANADVVCDWNATAGDIVVAPKPPAAISYRTMAIVQSAVYEAVNAITRRYPPDRVALDAAPGASIAAAVAAANRAILAKLAPSQQASIDSAMRSALSAVPDGPAKTEGIAVGERAANAILSLRADDGADLPESYRPQTNPGVYVPTTIPAAPQWPLRKPWIMTSADQFRPGPPPDLKSELWARDYNEIRALGAKNSSRRTAEQTEIARFWETTAPTIFAVLDAKYHYNLWRPITAIRNGDIDGNDATERDASWAPLIDTLMHPEYPCAHCIHAATVGAILQAEIGAGPVPKLSTSSPTAACAVRSWTRIDDFVREVANARIYDGVHYRNSTEVGIAMGQKIGALAAAKYLRR